MNKLRLISCVALLVVATAATSWAVAPTNRSQLVGTWVNVNPSTGGIVKVVITDDALGFRVRTYGACSPTPCDHGAIAASPFSKTVGSTVAYGLTANYNFGFKRTIITAKRVYEYDGAVQLEVEARNIFAAGDTRTDYMRTELYRRQ
jgi:hypothetical protein